jgi:hypothetical protein
LTKAEGASADEQRRTYTEWYVWAARNVSSTGEVRHACAKAAMDAKEEGADPATAARAAAQNRSGPGWTDQASPSIRAYAEWYDWARGTLKLAGEPLHDAAAAAVAEIERGGDATAAAQAAGLPAAGTQTGRELPTPTSPELPPPAGPEVPPPHPPQPTPPPPPTPPAQPAPPPSMAGYGAPIPPPAVAPPVYAYNLPPYPAPTGNRRRPAVEVPVWVAILIGVFCGMTLTVWPFNFVALLLYNLNPGQQFIAETSGLLCLLQFICALIALIAIVARARWARVMSIIAGATFLFGAALPLLSTVFDSLLFAILGILLGVSVIVGAAIARRPETY